MRKFFCRKGFWTIDAGLRPVFGAFVQIQNGTVKPNYVQGRLASGVKARAALLAHLVARLNRPLKKLGRNGEVEKASATGAEARLSFCDIYGPAEAVPLLQSRLQVEFFSNL